MDTIDEQYSDMKYEMLNRQTLKPTKPQRLRTLGPTHIAVIHRCNMNAGLHSSYTYNLLYYYNS